MTLPRTISLITVLLLAGQLCFAQSDTTSRKQYRVEVIAFQYRGPDSSGGEEFDRLIVENYLPGARFDIDRYNRVQETVSYTQLAQLRNTLERLRSRPQYSVLAASAWVQPLLSQRQAVDVPLGDFRGASGSGSSSGQSDSPQVAGTVRIYGGHLLFADVDLRVTLPRRPGAGSAPEQSVGAQSTGDGSFGRTRLDDGLRTLRISEQRRIKLDEVHYFDHPHIGAVLSVTRYQGGQ